MGSDSIVAKLLTILFFLLTILNLSEKYSFYIASAPVKLEIISGSHFYNMQLTLKKYFLIGHQVIHNQSEGKELCVS